MSNKHNFDNSSSIKHCDWNENDGLIIHFASGGVYHYPDATLDDHKALKEAASPGKHFHANLRKFRAVKQ